MGSNGKNLIKNGSLTKWSRVILRPYWYSEHGQCEPTPLLVWLYPLRGVLWDSTLFGLRLKTFVDPFRKHDLFIVFTTPVQTRPIFQCYSRLCISGCVSGWLSVCMQVCMSGCLHVCISACLPVSMSSLSVGRSLSLSVCMYLHQYVMTFKSKNGVVCAGPAVTSLVQCPRHPILAFGEWYSLCTVAILLCPCLLDSWRLLWLSCNCLVTPLRVALCQSGAPRSWSPASCSVLGAIRL
jgi:hypothetical protein